MSREIVAELRIWKYDIPFVILFDSWVLRTNELDIENIKKFITVSEIIKPPSLFLFFSTFFPVSLTANIALTER